MLGILSALSELITKSKSGYVTLATSIENESKGEALINIPDITSVTASPPESGQALTTPSTITPHPLAQRMQ